MNAPTSILRSIYANSGREDVDVRKLGTLVGYEPGLEDRILQYGRLFYRRMADNLTDGVRATALLGHKVVAEVAVQHALIKALEGCELPGGLEKRFWSDCIHRALAARLMAHRTQSAHQDQAFTAGLSLDWGVGALLVEQGMHLRWLSEGRPSMADDRLRMEDEIFGLNHVQAFVRYSNEWDLPSRLTSVIAGHHEAGGTLPPDGEALVQIARWADAVGEAISSASAAPALETCARSAASMGVHPDDAWAIIERVLRYSPYVAQALGVPINEQPTLEELRARTGDYRTMNPDAEFSAIVRTENDDLRKQVAELQEQLARATRQDPVTGLPNHNAFLSLAADAVSDCKKRQEDVCMLLVDLDGFTQVNARHGHASGDRLLELAARRLRGVTRPDNVIGRVGPDSFAILVPGGSRIGQVIAERARAAIEGMYLDVDGTRIRLTATVVGVNDENTAVERDHEWLMSEAQQVRSVHANRSRNRTIWTP